MKILLDSNDFMDEMDYDIFLDELRFILEEKTRKPSGEVLGFMFKSKRQSRYGAICNHGQTGFAKKITPRLYTAILSFDADSIVIWDDNGELMVSYYDHDGSHNCKVYPITKSKLQAIDNISHDFDKTLHYIDNKMTSLKIKQ